MLTKVIICLFVVSYTLHLGAFSYEHRLESTLEDDKISIHVLVVDPKENLIRPARVEGETSLETVSELAKRHGAIAGINGGFYKSSGEPAGILKIDGKWHSMPTKSRGSIGWTVDGQRVLIDRLLTLSSEQKLDEEQSVDIIPGLIPPHTTAEDWASMDHIVGGTPVIVSGGIVVDDYSPEKTLTSFLIERFARTAVGVREGGEWVFVVVDYPGITVKQLAVYMLDLGCVDALNLCGNHSSTMVVDGVVVNQPRGYFEKAVSDAILIFP